MIQVDAWPHINHTYDATIPGKAANDFIRTSGKNLTFIIKEKSGDIQWNTGSGDEAISWVPIDQTITGAIGESQFKTLQCLFWNKGQFSDQLEIGQLINIVAIIEVNEWRGRKTVQMRVKDLQSSSGI